MINFKKVRRKLTMDNVITIMSSWGVKKYDKGEKEIIFPTVCHNGVSGSSSMKLYYYDNTKMFKCYTECDEVFDIFELGARISKLEDSVPKNMIEIAEEIVRKIDLGIDVSGEEKPRFQSPLKPVIRTEMPNPYEKIDKKILKFFSKESPGIWEKEGITKEAMDKFDISYYPFHNKIVIPHFDAWGNLIGIRGRALNPEDIAKGKYMPLKVNNKLYNHSLSYNLYGLHITKENIRKSKVCYVFEGEKSVLLSETYFGENNFSVAACGSNITKHQVMRLISECGPLEIVVCFDRQFQTQEEEKEYIEKINKLCRKLSSFCNISYIYDKNRITDFKDSPIDKGEEVFMKLLEERIEIGAIKKK